MSTVFVAGGSGRVATELIKDLIADGHKVIAGSRHSDKIIKLAGVTAVNLDLHSSVDEIADLKIAWYGLITNRCNGRC